jgi:3-hydroxyacyl-[acyl-carrier-protein] dehydratase
MLNREQIMEILPHRDPFLLVDEITELSPGVRAVGILRVDERLDALRGHFPGNPVMPGVLQTEALAQVGGVAILTLDRYRGKLGLFGGIDKARFRRMVRPGDTLTLEVEIETLRDRAVKASGIAKVEGQIVCELSMLFMIGDKA